MYVTTFVHDFVRETTFTDALNHDTVTPNVNPSCVLILELIKKTDK